MPSGGPGALDENLTEEGVGLSRGRERGAGSGRSEDRTASTNDDMVNWGQKRCGFDVWKVGESCFCLGGG